MKNKIIFLFNLLLFFSAAHLSAADQLTGIITAKGGKEKIPGAIVFWEKTSKGTATDSLGNFKLAWPDSFPATLVVSCTGYKSKGIVFKSKDPAQIKVDLQNADSLEVVTIIEKRDASEFSFISPIMV